MINVETKFKSVRWSNGQFAIFVMEDGQSAKGETVGASPEQMLNVNVTLIGDWESSKFGQTFKFERYLINEDQMIFFLTKVIGNITEAAAKQIKAKFGDDLWRVMDESPNDLLEIKGIGEKKLKKILVSWGKNKSLLKLAQILSPHGVTNGQITKIHEHFGDNALDIVLKDPYRIIEMRGFGFKLADEIALKMGHSATDPARIKACAEYAIDEYASGGHSAMRPSAVFPIMEKALAEADGGGDVNHIKQKCFTGLLDLIHDKGAVFVIEHDEEDVAELIKRDEMITTKDMLEQERYILEKFKTTAEPNPVVVDIEAWINAYQDKYGVKFGDEQRDSIRLANQRYPILSVSGYAGTGKTTVSKAILTLLSEEIASDDILCVAVAGIAANRIKDKSGFEGKTIHSGLGFGREGYTYNEGNKLEYKVVALDEAGMADSEIMFNLLSAIDLKRTMFIMMGDPAQLQPIGCGQPYADALTNNTIPNVTLTKVFRTSEDQAINIIAQSVRNREMPAVNGNYEDFGFQDISIPNYQKLRNTLSKDELKKKRDENNLKIRDGILALAHAAKNDVAALVSPSTAWAYLTRFQVLTPMRAGYVGVEEMNAQLQEVFNPRSTSPEIKAGNRVFRINDKIVHLKNKDMTIVPIDRYKAWLKDDDEDHTSERRVMNGQLGIVINVEDEELHVFYPIEKYVNVYSAQELSMLQHSYALTVHKTQGSEFHQVAFPITMSHYNMLRPQLLYTTITRAKARIDVIGEADAFRAACRDRPGDERVTVFNQILKQEQLMNKPALRPV
ncbi:MAG: hypothetical protein CTY35_00620 [Methylotenera sp.]|uniref:AAA family ATPase n=1 Tax=Methylotenera sp. TaxID=2051956 RepID=UPI000D44D788|nr:AAA family ATPase [Methylotenera sp.]PPC84857.1 MAG: hypothetical protein CTY38_00615 [Methylotenera sp.]PPD02217.1 MAG: hypothetical protein CTY35_00620 [Methylotenera sp.]